MNPFLIVALLCSIGGMLLGGGAVNLKRLADIAQIKADQLGKENAALETYKELYADEVNRGDTLSAQLAQTESQLTQRTLEVSLALQKVTTGRACLGSAAVRLLNSADRVDRAAPEAAGPSVTEDGAVATDTDVAGWIGNAQGQYETCRARLGSLIDYEIGRPDERTEQ